MQLRCFVILLLLLPSFTKSLVAQDSTKISVSGYADVYYGAGKASEGKLLPDYYFNFRRTKEVGINIALLKLALTSAKVRGNVGVMAGNYVQYNLSGEDEAMRHIYEANVGVKLSKKENIWFDAGIFPSHLGFESAISVDCWMPSRSFVAENSPYYEAGAKLSYQSTDAKWFVSGLLLNGWQSLQLQTPKPSFGVQVTYLPSANWVVNYSNFYGDVLFDTSLDPKKRLYHNLYAIHTNQNWGVTLGFDYGTDKWQGKSVQWYTPVAILRYITSDKLTLSARAEYFKNIDHFASRLDIRNLDFKDVKSLSVAASYVFTPQVSWRNEVKLLNERSAAMPASSTNPYLLSVLSVRF